MIELFEETNNAKKENKSRGKGDWLVDFHKMHLTGVIFKKFKWNVPQIVNDVILCTLPDDAIAALMTLFPLSPDEVKRLQHYIDNHGDTGSGRKLTVRLRSSRVAPSTLDVRENLFSNEKTNILQVPEDFFLSVFKNVNINTRERLECCAFRNNVGVLLKDIHKHTSIIQKACSSLRRSKKFASVLRIIFKMGTILNKDSYLANSAGFTLDILPNLKDTRTKHGANFLQFLVRDLKSSILDHQKN